MLKRFFSFLLISGFYFFLTSLAINYIKSIDPLMLSLKENISYYEIDPVNAIIFEDSIVPGKKGVSIDVDSSYSLMRKYGSFNEGLLVYKEISPEITIANIYSKYISSGNYDEANVSLIFKVDDYNNVEEIVEILKAKDVIGTFFLNEELIYDKDLIIYLYLNNQEVEYYSDVYDFNKLNDINIYVSSYITKNLSYCYNDIYNKENIVNCSLKRVHMIIPSINTSIYPFHDVKKNISNGSIIKLDNNNVVVEELRHIINFIRQKNYDIVSLKKLLEE